MQPEQVQIIGGGLVGALAAVFMAQRDIGVRLFEQREDIRAAGAVAGRSINLAVTARGLLALEQVGLCQAVLDIGIPMRGRMVHALDGGTSLVPYGQRPEEVIYSVSRGELNKLLLRRACEFSNVDAHFNHRCVGYDVARRTLALRDELSGKQHAIPAHASIATDGAWSQVRRSMLAELRNLNYSQDFLAHGYKELVIPAAGDGGFSMEKHALHIWPRQSFMLIALPNLDGSFTCTLFLQYEGEVSFAALKTPQQVQNFFQRNFADAAAMMPTLAEDFFSNPTGSMVTVRCSPWHVADDVLLLGDAAHAIVPFFGQGMNCGFEDCFALGRLLDAHGPDWRTIFPAMEAERKPNADAIAAMAVENFLEMRDTVADPKFLLKKEIGFELERRFPHRFIPRYSMVVFHPEIPYAAARSRAIEQDKVLDQLAANISSASQADWQKAQSLLDA